MLKHKYAILLGLLVCQTLLSMPGDAEAGNKAANIWYFGEAGLDFSNGVPQALAEQVTLEAEGSAVICDDAGRLRFYTDGMTVWDASHQRMPNGVDLMGSPSVDQPALIVPQPGSPDIFYLFTVSERVGLYYSTVNLTLNAGGGDVSEKNGRLWESTGGQITAVRHQDGEAIWVIAAGQRDNTLRAYLVTAAGVQPTPTISATGRVHTESDVDRSGYLKASPDGRKLALSVFDPGFFELFDFDAATGQVSNARVLGAHENAYGLEFSPDSSKLYGTMKNWVAKKVVQFDLNAADIPGSVKMIGKTSADTRFKALQVAPDGRIYVIRENAPHLGVINNPNQAGTDSAYVDEGVYLAGRRGRSGFPNFVQSLFLPPVITLAIQDATVNEGDGSATFAVSLSDRSRSDVTVKYATMDGTAAAAADYTPKSGVLTIPAGELSSAITVAILDDQEVDEGAETFTVELAEPVNAILDKAQAVGTIIDNDLVRLTISDARGRESDGRLSFGVTLSGASRSDTSVQYATQDGSAKAGRDYRPASGSLVIPAGATSGTISVGLIDDAVNEVEQTFTVSLLDPVNATLAVSQATGTILDDDPPPALTIEDAAMPEQTGTMSFAVKLSAVTKQDVLVNYATADGTAEAGQDYTPSAGTLFIPAGQTFGTVLVDLRDDALPEAAETLRVRLSQPVNATLARGEAQGTIKDNDPPPTLTCADVSAAEDAGVLRFEVKLSAPSGQPVAVAYATQDGTAAANADYAPAAGVLQIPAGRTAAEIPVTIYNDLDREETETLTLTLRQPVNAVLGQTQATGAIRDDDPPPALSINDVKAVERTGRLTFTVSLSAKSYQEVSVKYVTVDGTAAIADNDYQLIPESVLTFPAGATRQNIAVTIYDDTRIEGDETLLVRLFEPVNATLAKAEGTGVMRNDDALPVVSVDDASVAKDAGFVTFRVRLSAPSALPVIFTYRTLDGAVEGAMAIAPGSLEGEIVVPLPDAPAAAGEKSVRLELGDVCNAIFGQASGIAVIHHND